MYNSTDWNDKQEVILGNAGEKYISNFLLSKGCYVYPQDWTQDKPYPVDGVCITPTGYTYLYDVKTQESMNHYNCTGINTTSLKKYKELSENINVYIYFVDSKLGKVLYGNVPDLIKPISLDLEYPYTGFRNGRKTMIPLFNMTEIKDLSAKEIEYFKSLRVMA